MRATTDWWITALRAPQIAALAADQGPLQMSLFDTQDLVEIVHPDYPGERLIACRNPLLAAQRACKRHNLLAATEKLLGPIKSRVQSGRLAGAADIGKAVGKVIGKYKVAKHFDTTISDDSFTYHRNQAAIDAEAALDGIYVIRTSVDAAELAPARRSVPLVRGGPGRDCRLPAPQRTSARYGAGRTPGSATPRSDASTVPTNTPQRDRPVPAATAAVTSSVRRTPRWCRGRSGRRSPAAQPDRRRWRSRWPGGVNPIPALVAWRLAHSWPLSHTLIGYRK